MVYTRAQAKRKAVGDPIYEAPPARRARRGKTRKSIEDLPNEQLLFILALILEKWAYPIYLYALARVNRRFNMLAVPFLYEEITIDEDVTHSIPLLFRTLLLVPQLAHFVKHVQWNLNAKQIVLTNSAQATDLIRSFGIPTYRSWVVGLEEGSPHIILGLLLCITPQLESISIYSGDIDPADIPGYIQPLLYAARGTSFGTVHNFKHLSYLSIEYCSIRPGYSSVYSMARGTSAMGVSATVLVAEASRCYRHTLCYSHIHDDDQLFLSVAFQFGGRAWMRVEPNWFRTIERALQIQRESLERISFDEMNIGLWIPPTQTIISQLEGLMAFPLLSTYAGPLVTLLSVAENATTHQLAAISKRLPQSIEHLLLEVYPAWDPLPLFDIIDQHATAVFPCLKRLYIRYRMISPNNPPYALLDLATYFADSKILFSYILDLSYARPTADSYLGFQDSLRELGESGAELAEHCYSTDVDATDWTHKEGWHID